MGKTDSQSLEVDKLVASATPNVAMGRRVTWAPNVSSTSLPVPPVPHNLSRPQSLPIPVSSLEPSPQESPQASVFKSPKRSRAHRVLSHFKGFFV